MYKFSIYYILNLENICRKDEVETFSIRLYEVNLGWKPGAVTVKLLRMVNKAKLRKSSVEAIRQTKRIKKQTEDKPLLIVSKQNGEYHVEMQVKNSEEDQYKPLIYKIESMNNKIKIRQKEWLQRKLVKAAEKEVWSDPYHSELCEQICLKTYKETISVQEENKEDDVEIVSSCSCDKEVSLSCDSSEIDWEIHFTPPLMCHQAMHQKHPKDQEVLF